MNRFAAVVALLGLSLQPVRAQQPGYRAVNLAFDSDRVFYLAPDDVIDVIAVMAKPPKSSPAEEADGAATMLKRVRVLAVRPSETSPGESVVRLTVNANEAQYLEVAAHQGSLWLTLRKKGDVEDHPLEVATWNKILKSEFRAVRGPRDHERHEGAAVAGGLAGAETLAAVAGRMREAYPAISVPIASDKAMFVKPGDRIDVLATIEARRPESSAKIRLTKTLLQNVLVLDNRRSASRPGRNILLLAMNYNEIQYAALAWETSEIQISSRNGSDKDVFPIEPATLDKWW